MPYLTPKPSSPAGSSVEYSPLPVSRAPSLNPVTSGRSSRLRLSDKSDRPSRVPNWVSWPATPREIGDHDWASDLSRMTRVIWKPQRWPTPAERDG